MNVGGTVKTAEAVVWVRLWLKDDEQYKLTSWKLTDDKDLKPVGGKAVHLKITDSGAKVSASVGDLVIIELEANPSTGYSWEAKPATGKTILELKSREFLALAQLNPEIQPAPGQGGITRFTYRVTDTGKAAILLVYRRPGRRMPNPPGPLALRLREPRRPVRPSPGELSSAKSRT